MLNQPRNRPMPLTEEERKARRKEYLRNYARNYRAQHSATEEQKEAKRKYHREYYAANREKIIERNNKWYHSEHGKRIRRSWQRSEKGKTEATKNNKTEKRIISRRRFNRILQLRKRGATQELWTATFKNQGEKCAICKTINPGAKFGWCSDHDHRTGKFRGVLCVTCN